MTALTLPKFEDSSYNAAPLPPSPLGTVALEGLHGTEEPSDADGAVRDSPQEPLQLHPSPRALSGRAAALQARGIGRLGPAPSVALTADPDDI